MALRGARGALRYLQVALVGLAGALTLAVPVAVGGTPGVVTEFTEGLAPAQGLRGIAGGPDGNLWFTDLARDRVGRITPAGKVTEFSAGITAGGHPQGITAGPDGNIWFTESDGSRIGRTTPAGDITEFTSGLSGGSYPADITVGPDRALWFAEHFGNRIGRITTAGIITEFNDAKLAGSGPNGIAAGPDGNLWFTEQDGNAIGRISVGGFVEEFPIATAASVPVSIARGPDDNLWFTMRDANRIGRITPSGAITEFGGLTAGSKPLWITAGADGNLWFTEQGGHRIGRITTAGLVTEFSAGISPGAAPFWIAAGPDLNLWFVEPSLNRIGRITSGVDPPSTPTSAGTPTPAGPPTPSPPAREALRVSSARLSATWAESLVRRGTLRVGFLAPRAARVGVQLTRLQRGKVQVLRSWTTRIGAPGRVTRSLLFRGRLLPGSYTVRAREVGEKGETALGARLEPPAEGVVQQAFITTTVGGGPKARIPGGTVFQIYGIFRFAARPAKGQRLSATWRLGGFRSRRGLPRPSGDLLVSTIGSTRAGILVSGNWSVTLRAGSSVIARARVRIG